MKLIKAAGCVISELLYWPLYFLAVTCGLAERNHPRWHKAGDGGKGKSCTPLLLLLSIAGVQAQSGQLTYTLWPADGTFPATLQISFEQQQHHTARLHVSDTMQGPRASWPVIAFYDCYPLRQTVSGWYPVTGTQLFFATTGDNCNGPALVEWTPPELPDLLDNPMGLP